uniref:U2A'/phosphoprotein 32 family A C-terminal domain-containing protein n=1 Tax=Eutreptiella gymnastica TaxID=73025 RepID=A0A7S1HYF6_9EUGL|mmetsp:Transcript_114367/g.198881  ORF Transcript_114367/g.198881 Transcript_114367/m.198881 type:complete len:1498 (+) Transcript_114367:104-4597(+)
MQVNGSFVEEGRAAYAEDGDVRYFCDANGVSKDDFLHKRHQVTNIELFLYDTSSLHPVAFFPGLKSLQVSCCELVEIDYLQGLTGLEQLWLNENNITHISGLDTLTQLKDLYLYTNQIKKIEGLDSLKNLEVLWLMENSITKIEGLEKLTNLKTLNLGSNLIESIGTRLDPNTALTDLNLAANRLGSFRDIPPLDRLPKLQALCFVDPHFGENPLCQLCNYQTYTLYHLNRLTMLDKMKITDEQRHLAEATFVKKKMYYNMRIKTLKRNTNNLLKKAAQFKGSKVGEIKTGVAALMKTIKALEREREEPKYLDEAGLNGVAGAVPAAEIASSTALVQSHLSSKMKLIEDIEVRFEEMTKMILSISQHSISRMMIELQTGGNIRLEEGRPTDVWFKSCVDLFKSRFFPSDYIQYGLKDVKVVKVTRIHNRNLRNRFEEHLQDIVDLSDPAYKRSLEYLFFGEDPELPGDLLKALEDGLRCASDYERLGKDAGIPLTNSASICDQARVQDLVAQGLIGPNAATISGEALTGRLLITKVFLGKCVQEKGESRPSDAPLVSRRKDAGRIRRSDYSAQTTSVYRAKAGDPKQRVWFCFEKALALPEYLLEYVYVPSVPPSRITGVHLPQDVEELHQVIGKLLPTRSEVDAVDIRSLAYDFLGFMQYCNSVANTDQDASQATKFPFLRKERRLPDLTDDVLRRVCPNQDPGKTLYLNLIGVGLKKMDSLSLLTSIRVLSLSFNELSKIDAIQDMPMLTRLDLSYNQIRRLEGLRGLPSLLKLELDNNQLHRWEDINLIKRNLTSLQDLSLSTNPLCEAKHYRHTVLRRLTSLDHLDGIAATPEDKEAASDTLTSMTNRLILEHGQVGPLLAWSTPLTPFHCKAKRLDENGAWYGPVEHATGTPAMSLIAATDAGYNLEGDRFDSILGQILELSLVDKGIRKIQNLNKLKKLRKLNLGDNEISKIEGLEFCGKIEELNIENNQIIKIECLDNLLHLRKLDIGKNKISSFEGLERLPHLSQLSVEDNEVTSLAGLSKLQNLLELYVGNNRLADVKEVNHLRAVPRLIILDMSGNPLCKDKEYRLYSIYHLKKLKVLDGVSIDGHESAKAKETFTGKMTPELLLEKVGPTVDWGAIVELSLSSCGIKELSLLEGFTGLLHLKLDHNLLPSISGLQCLSTLISLNASFNRLHHDHDLGHVGQVLAYCPRLEHLDLEANNLPSIGGLQLRNGKLQRLNLRNNEITKVDGLDALPSLTELHLDKNKLRLVDYFPDFCSRTLRVLTITDNMLKTLEGLRTLSSLQTMHLTSNRISDITELDRFDCMEQLREISISGNAVGRKNGFRFTLLSKLPSLVLVDGKDVTPEEKERARHYFSPEYQQYGMAGIPPNVVTAPQTLTLVSYGSGGLGQQPAQMGKGGAGAMNMKFAALEAMGGQGAAVPVEPSTGQKVIARMRQQTFNPAGTGQPSRLAGQGGGAKGRKAPTQPGVRSQFASPRPPSGSVNTRLPRM